MNLGTLQTDPGIARKAGSGNGPEDLNHGSKVQCPAAADRTRTLLCEIDRHRYEESGIRHENDMRLIGPRGTPTRSFLDDLGMIQLGGLATTAITIIISTNMIGRLNGTETMSRKSGVRALDRQHLPPSEHCGTGNVRSEVDRDLEKWTIAESTGSRVRRDTRNGLAGTGRQIGFASDLEVIRVTSGRRFSTVVILRAFTVAHRGTSPRETMVTCRMDSQEDHLRATIVGMDLRQATPTARHLLPCLIPMILDMILIHAVRRDAPAAKMYLWWTPMLWTDMPQH